jgi:hypothetical protein
MITSMKLVLLHNQNEMKEMPIVSNLNTQPAINFKMFKMLTQMRKNRKNH